MFEPVGERVARAGVGGEPASEPGHLDRDQIDALAGVAPMKRDSARFEPPIAAAGLSAITSVLDVQDPTLAPFLRSS